MFLKFEGAAMTEGDNGREYKPRGPIWIESNAIVAYYSHTVLTNQNKIRVMETEEDIRLKLRPVREG